MSGSKANFHVQTWNIPGSCSFTLYENINAPHAPLVVDFEMADQGMIICKNVCALTTLPFHFLVIHNIRWDEDLSPWKQAPVVEPNDHFTGEAPAFLKRILTGILPGVLHHMEWKPGPCIIAGYSMGGLFALYASVVSEQFAGVVCASGSVWFPGFATWVSAHPYEKKPRAIYLSLGDRESHVSNPVLRTTGSNMERLLEDFQAQDINCILQWNRGNHFRNPAGRLAKGIAWVLEQLEQNELAGFAGEKVPESVMSGSERKEKGNPSAGIGADQILPGQTGQELGGLQENRRQAKEAENKAGSKESH